MLKNTYTSIHHSDLHTFCTLQNHSVLTPSPTKYLYILFIAFTKYILEETELLSALRFIQIEEMWNSEDFVLRLRWMVGRTKLRVSETSIHVLCPACCLGN